jgi:hypoxanthine phosphoribosyltransferase
MADLVAVLKKKEIENAVITLAGKISSDYHKRELVLIAVLKGAFIFLSDLVRHLTIPAKIDFVRLSSYGSNTSSSKKVRLTKEIEIDIKGKDVLIVEDIVDTGFSLQFLIDYLKDKEPRSIKICTFIDKHERREVNFNIDYIGHTVSKGFLVGYGLDYAEDYRNLPEVYHLIL